MKIVTPRDVYLKTRIRTRVRLCGQGRLLFRKRAAIAAAATRLKFRCIPLNRRVSIYGHGIESESEFSTMRDRRKPDVFIIVKCRTEPLKRKVIQSYAL